MGRFDRSKDRRNRSSPRRESSGRGNYGGRRESRSFEDFKRDSGRKSYGDKPRRSSRDHEMTRVTCSSCGDKCEVPFKPTSDKPLFCNKCFKKGSRGGSDNSSNKDLNVINEKLDKIMKALNID